VITFEGEVIKCSGIDPYKKIIISLIMPSMKEGRAKSKGVGVGDGAKV